ncbi:MAG: hypothetical protein HPY59_15405 [Anaerolineae bacterium]|nr:hypothetical protein [Anaerolineae bacterium]
MPERLCGFAISAEQVSRATGQLDAAVLLATGISPLGERQVFGVSAPFSEHETRWKALLMDSSEEWQIGKHDCSGKSFDC